jgi:CheY-like chemotaxis protein
MPTTLLLADGNPTIQRIVAMTFAGQEFTVLNVNDGDEAVATIAAERPDIVLADVAMPKRSGYEVAAFVKQRPDLAHIPVLLLAGALEPVDEARAIEAQCNGVLVKPFEPQQVVARVRELVRGGKGHPTQTVPGVARPIERLLEQRSAAAFAEPSSKVVKHPSALTRPVAPVPPRAAGAKVEAAGDPLGDYFDQLDVAFGTEGPSPSARAAETQDDDTDRLDLPTLNSVLGDVGHAPSPLSPAPFDFKDEILFAAAPVDPPDIRPVPPATVREIPAFRPEPAAPASLADRPSVDLDLRTPENAFEALIAVDRQARDEEQARAKVAGSAGAPIPAMNDALIEAVAARVIEKLAPRGVDDLVRRVVADVAERLVREEIERIRGRK